jgi:hypothetical protein
VAGQGAPGSGAHRILTIQGRRKTNLYGARPTSRCGRTPGRLRRPPQSAQPKPPLPPTSTVYRDATPPGHDGSPPPRCLLRPAPAAAAPRLRAATESLDVARVANVFFLLSLESLKSGALGAPIHHPGWRGPAAAHPGMVYGPVQFPFFAFSFSFFYFFVIFCFFLFFTI